MDLLQTAKEIKYKLGLIESGELCLDGAFNKNYSHWYSNDLEKFIYEDPKGVFAAIQEAMDFVQQRGNQEAGDEISRILVDLKVAIGGDHLLYTSVRFSIEELKIYYPGCLDYGYFEVIKKAVSSSAGTSV